MDGYYTHIQSTGLYEIESADRMYIRMDRIDDDMGVESMTIGELINDLREYAKDSPKGFDTEVRSYVGMSKQAALDRITECESDEYVFDDFLPISYIHETNGFVYIRATDIPEVEPQKGAIRNETDYQHIQRTI